MYTFQFMILLYLCKFNLCYLQIMEMKKQFAPWKVSLVKNYFEGLVTKTKSEQKQEVDVEAAKFKSSLLSPDAGCKYDQTVKIDLSTLEPHVNGPFTPDLATPISQLGEAKDVHY